MHEMPKCNTECVFIDFSILVMFRFSKYPILLFGHINILSQHLRNPNPENSQRQQDTVARLHLSQDTKNCQLPAQGHTVPADVTAKTNMAAARRASYF